MPECFPTLFLSHGAPNLGLRDTPVRRFLRALAEEIPKPDAVVVASAHFETPGAVVVSDPSPGMIYDFRGFEPELYDTVYPAPGHPELALQVASLIGDAGLPVSVSADRGYDHGTWVPLSQIWPDADIPIVQVSIDPDQGPAYHYKLGQSLKSLRNRNVAVIGTGQITHNLEAVFRKGQNPELDANISTWVGEFLEWFDDRLVNGPLKELLDYQNSAPHAKANHPTDEHLLPIFFARGAAGEDARSEKIHHSKAFGFMAMDAWAFR